MNTKQIMSIGFFANVAEWYDFSIYAFLAVTIGELFFVSHNPQLSVIKAFFLFTASYLIRPIGAFFWGYFGDRYGRKSTLKWCLIIMAVPTVLIGILPTYNYAGIVATIFLIMFRLIQGFAAGGEVPISACYIYEVSPQARKNFFCSLVAASAVFGVLLGSTVGFIIHALFTLEAIALYAWRIPFLFGIVVFLLVLYVRKNINETIEFKNASHGDGSNTWKDIFKFNANLIKFLQFIALYAFNQTVFYLIFIWMPSHLQVDLHISEGDSFLSNTIGIAFLIICTLLAGYLAEQIKPKKIIIFSILSVIILSFPLFLLLQTKNLVLIVVVQSIFALSLGCMNGVMVNVLGRSFDVKTRCRGVSIGFTLPTAIFGGLLPTLCSYLIYKTGIELVPVFFLVFISLMVLPVAIRSNIL